MATFALTKEHAAPLAVGVASGIIMAWGGSKVSKARKKYGVKYPTMYAVPGVAPEGISDEDANHFNCVQRAHQNMLEGHPTFLLLCTY